MDEPPWAWQRLRQSTLGVAPSGYDASMSRASILLGLLLLLAGIAASLFAQDEITVAAQSPCIALTGNPIDVPVYIRDLSGTPLGLDQPAGKRIQGISFQVAYSPANYVTSIAVKRAGILAPRVPVSEFALANANTVSYLALFEEQFNTIQYHLDAPRPGDLVAVVVVTLGPAAVPGSRMDFKFGDSATTSLTDQNGVTAETEADGFLRPQSGCVQLVEPRRRVVRR